jgi:hypothetical protein
VKGRPGKHTIAALLLGGLVADLAAQGMGGQGIYTCIDGKGRKLTSDRPIAECVDREQLELNPSGTVRRRIGPSLTAKELAAQEAQARQLAEERARLAEEKRRDRALLIRYPSRAVHDKERIEALAQVDEVIKAARKRLGELQEQRKAIDAELEFYKKDPTKVPHSLKRQMDENTQSTGVQVRFMGEQDEEKKRINARFDDELIKLKQLWALQVPAASHPESWPLPTATSGTR